MNDADKGLICFAIGVFGCLGIMASAVINSLILTIPVVLITGSGAFLALWYVRPHEEKIRQ
jgi:hypothetical protein